MYTGGGLHFHLVQIIQLCHNDTPQRKGGATSQRCLVDNCQCEPGLWSLVCAGPLTHSSHNLPRGQYSQFLSSFHQHYNRLHIAGGYKVLLGKLWTKLPIWIQTEDWHCMSISRCHHLTNHSPHILIMFIFKDASQMFTRLSISTFMQV